MNNIFYCFNFHFLFSETEYFSILSLDSLLFLLQIVFQPFLIGLFVFYQYYETIAISCADMSYMPYVNVLFIPCHSFWTLTIILTNSCAASGFFFGFTLIKTFPTPSFSLIYTSSWMCRPQWTAYCSSSVLFHDFPVLSIVVPPHLHT